LARERGYLSFLRVQAREEPGPLLHALSRGQEVDTVMAALVEAGPAIEGSLLELLSHAPPAVAEGAIAVLGEVGGADAHEALERLSRQRRTLASAARTARRHVAERLARGRPANGEEAGARRLVLFGPPRLEVEGRAVPPASWRSQRAFQMLVY